MDIHVLILLIDFIWSLLLTAQAFCESPTLLWLLHQQQSCTDTDACKTGGGEPAAVCGPLPWLCHWHRGWRHQEPRPARSECSSHVVKQPMRLQYVRFLGIKKQTNSVLTSCVLVDSVRLLNGFVIQILENFVNKGRGFPTWDSQNMNLQNVNLATRSQINKSTKWTLFYFAKSH